MPRRDLSASLGSRVRPTTYAPPEAAIEAPPQQTKPDPIVEALSTAPDTSPDVPVTPPTPEDAGTRAVPDVRTESPADPKPRAPRARAAKRTAEPAPADDASATAQGADTRREPVSDGIPVYLPTDIEARLQAYMTRTTHTHPTVLMDAIEDTYDRLEEIIRDALAYGTDHQVPEKRGALFDRPTNVAPKPAAARAKHVVRITRKNRLIIDRIVEEVGAPNRTFFITAVYDAFLPPITQD